MDYSCCEILATFNLLSIAGKFDYKDNVGNITNDINKYFKLSAEFEINDLMFGQIIPTGRFGSKPSGIGNCLAAYDVNFKYYNWIDEDIDDTLKNSSCFSIISVFSTPNIHTYNVFYDSSKNSYVAINCGSGNLYGWEFSSIYESCRGNLLIGAYILL